MKSKIHILFYGLTILIASCAGSPEPYPFEPDNELKPGPGLFSGETGEFTVFRIPNETNHKETTSPTNQKGNSGNASLY